MTAPLPYTKDVALASDPGWWLPVRRESLDSFRQMDFPSSRQEDWKYTPLTLLERLHLHAPAANHAHQRPPVYPGQVLGFRNDSPLGHGIYHGDYEYDELIFSLQRAAGSQTVQEHLGRLAGDTALVKLNNALWRDGAHVLVAAGSHITTPIFLAFQADEAEAMLCPRSLIVVEAGGEAILVEHYLGQTDAPYWQNAVSEIVLETGARLTHIKVLEDGPAATHTGLTAVRLSRDSSYRALHVGLNGSLARHDLRVELEGEGAEVGIDAFNLASGRQISDLHLRVEHRVPHTRSRVNYRGLIDDRGSGVFDGRVVVHPAALQTDAQQICRSMLLSPQAEADAKPQLEIYADDVKCSHGASVGRLDAAAMFYLQSRGIAARDARRLLLQAFAGETLGLLDETGLREWLMPRLLARLPMDMEAKA